MSRSSLLPPASAERTPVTPSQPEYDPYQDPVVHDWLDEFVAAGPMRPEVKARFQRLPDDVQNEVQALILWIPLALALVFGLATGAWLVSQNPPSAIWPWWLDAVVFTIGGLALVYTICWGLKYELRARRRRKARGQTTRG